MASPKEQHQSFHKKLLVWCFYALLPVAIFRLYFRPIPIFSPSESVQETPGILVTPLPVEKRVVAETSCDYTNGTWVVDEMGPLYNGSSCGTIKDGQNCLSHGRPDLGFLNWRWKPKGCEISRFDPNLFLEIIRNKHIAFVGDSMARNQMESLLCLLSSVSSPELVYSNGEDNKFRKYLFKSHNTKLSIYWSPFLVKGNEKSEQESFNSNRLFLDSVNEKWSSDLDQMDMVVLSVGHWFLHPAIYFNGDSVLGCHSCNGENNYTEIGFYDVFGKAFKTTLKAIIDKKKRIDVFVTTFSPHHFEGEWDKFGACPRTEPFKEGEKELQGMDAEMRKAEVAEVEAAQEEAKKLDYVRVQALDVTKLALMRPDGHPGPYLYPNPFQNGIAERVQNDCVHWCLPGPIDTWNELLLDVLKRWKRQV